MEKTIVAVGSIGKKICFWKRKQESVTITWGEAIFFGHVALSPAMTWHILERDIPLSYSRFEFHLILHNCFSYLLTLLPIIKYIVKYTFAGYFSIF